MATIYKRKDTVGPSWRVQIRRKGLPPYNIVFDTLEEAHEWALENEFKFIDDPAAYLEWIKEERLRLRRSRERKRRGAK